jgi:hypothetical protein
MEQELKLYHPNGEIFSSYTEVKQQAELERQRAEKLAAKLRELGLNPDEI